MPALYNFSEYEIMALFLVVVRLGSFVVSWPIFGGSMVPAPAKILFALALALMIFPVITWQDLTVSTMSNDIIWLTIKEVFVGVSFGFLARMFFFAINMAGSVISVSMGLSSGELFNPALESRITPLEQVQITLATLFFLAIQGHHLFLSGIVDSFRIIPITQMGLNFDVFANIGVIAQEIMVIGIKVASPVMISILFMNIAMAIIGRAVPQINVLITSLPVNILVGFGVLIITVPMFIWQMESIVEVTTTRLFQILKSY